MMLIITLRTVLYLFIMVLIMVCPAIDLELYKAEIISLFHEDYSTAHITSIIEA
ncbi:uncharacterized protein BO87DRAFT_443350 [Aspergillus neoniger CBS 115656]|uniref:Uncharacterized protein n=1 Tax=Aspergillus neoniger (strain CBS 115656) TaxID=1448310 RepID=A0A318ZF28_ASPNB|nr:hypothetical protein BO87DRAFT_443350 [Aspergillus neoniger CBS 115656]PYH38858.1 hypothetical protein BO87DRAFT_443350 [Aspergillus neoniger CBS 115656]